MFDILTFFLHNNLNGGKTKFIFTISYVNDLNNNTIYYLHTKHSRGMRVQIHYFYLRRVILEVPEQTPLTWLWQVLVDGIKLILIYFCSWWRD